MAFTHRLHQQVVHLHQHAHIERIGQVLNPPVRATQVRGLRYQPLRVVHLALGQVLEHPQEGYAVHVEVDLQPHHAGDGFHELVVELSDDALGLTRPRWAFVRPLHALGRASEIDGRHNHHGAMTRSRTERSESESFEMNLT